MKIISPPKSTPLWSKFRFLDNHGYDVPDSWGLLSSYQKSYQQRRKTFFEPWTFPRISQSITDLSLSGFRYYRGEADLVQCVYCSVILGAWEEGDCPFRSHKTASPQCPQVKRFQHDLFITCDCGHDSFREARRAFALKTLSEEPEEEFSEAMDIP